MDLLFVRTDWFIYVLGYCIVTTYRSDGSLRVNNSEICLDVGSRASCQEQPWSTYPYCNPHLDLETRATDLVGRMTIIEKVGMHIYPDFLRMTWCSMLQVHVALLS